MMAVVDEDAGLQRWLVWLELEVSCAASAGFLKRVGWWGGLRVCCGGTQM